MSPLKKTTKHCAKANKDLVDKVKLFIQKSRTELQELSKSISSQRQSLSNTQSSSANISKPEEEEEEEEETNLIEELPASIAINNTLSINPSEMELLLGIPYPGHVHSLEDLQVKYTPQQRKQIYDHIVSTIPTPEHLRFKALHEAVDNEKLSFSSNNIRKSSRPQYGSNHPSFNKELCYVIETQMQALHKTIQVPPDNCHKERSKTKNDCVTTINQEADRSPKYSHTHNRDNNYKSTNKKQQSMNSSRKISKDWSVSSNRKQNLYTSPSRQYNNTPSSKRQHHSYSKQKPENQSPRQITNRQYQHHRWRQNNDYHVG